MGYIWAHFDKLNWQFDVKNKIIFRLDLIGNMSRIFQQSLAFETANSMPSIKKRTFRTTKMLGLAPTNCFFLRRISPLMDCWQMGKINNFMFALHRKKAEELSNRFLSLCKLAREMNNLCL
jgi:hypothetical protein